MSQDDYGRLYYNQNWFGMKADQLLPNALMRNPNSLKKMGDAVMLSYRDKVFPARTTPGASSVGSTLNSRALLMRIRPFSSFQPKCAAHGLRRSFLPGASGRPW